MQTRRCIQPVAILLAILIFVFPAAIFATDQQAKPAAPAADSDYAGTDTCKTCHQDIYEKGFARTPHFKTTLNNGHGCESCHGPGAEHVAGGGDVSKIISFKKISRQEANQHCLSCHGENHEQAHFAQSVHASNEVSCIDCHSPHQSQDPQFLLVQKQPKLCYRCHTSAKADFSKPYHHRVNEGLVQCSDCHNVHGTATLRQVRAFPTGDAVCFKCHADKQGPFVYEHVPVKTEGCSSCHTPHGSTNPRFLRVSQMNMLCLQCHTAPTASPLGPAHNLSQKYQACTMCHEAIHGSNFSAVFFK
jgi:DmsE family decaheme c-type cytochrome